MLSQTLKIIVVSIRLSQQSPYRCRPHQRTGSSRQTRLVAATSQSVRIARPLATRCGVGQPHLRTCVCPLKWVGGKRACTLVAGTQVIALKCQLLRPKFKVFFQTINIGSSRHSTSLRSCSVVSRPDSWYVLTHHQSSVIQWQLAYNVRLIDWRRQLQYCQGTAALRTVIQDAQRRAERAHSGH